MLLGTSSRAVAQVKPTTPDATLAQNAAKQLIGHIRMGRDAEAIRQLDLEGQARFLFGDGWS